MGPVLEGGGGGRGGADVGVNRDRGCLLGTSVFLLGCPRELCASAQAWRVGAGGGTGVQEMGIEEGGWYRVGARVGGTWVWWRCWGVSAGVWCSTGVVGAGGGDAVLGCWCGTRGWVLVLGSVPGCWCWYRVLILGLEVVPGVDPGMLVPALGVGAGTGVSPGMLMPVWRVGAGTGGG